MKKGKYLSIALAMVFTAILLGTSAYGQYAYNADFAPRIFTEKVDKKKTTIDTRGIEEISLQIKNELDFQKERMDVTLEGELTVEILIAKNGTIEDARVIKGDNTNLNMLVESIVFDMEAVTPIAYNGMTKRKVVRIPIIFRK